MSIDLPLDSMSVAEKMEAMETIWLSLCQKPGDVRSPEWHEEVLAERTRRLASGDSIVSSWADARSRLMKLGE